MHFTQTQVSKILEDILQKEDGLNTILKLSLEALMKAEFDFPLIYILKYHRTL